MVFADPPYNVCIKSVQGRGKIKHGEFAMASGEMSKAQFTTFLTDTLSSAARHSADGAIHYVCMDWRHLDEMLDAGKEVYSELKNLVVWNKTNAGQGSFYRSQHELIFVFKNGDGATHEQFRARAARPQPLERVDLCRREFVSRRAGWTSFRSIRP